MKYLKVLSKYINDDYLREQITWKPIIKKDGSKGYLPSKETTYVVPSSFDIETSSINFGTEEAPVFRTNMYIWQFGIGFYPENYDVIFGRTWEEFDELLEDIATLTAYESKKGTMHHCFRCWVHNLPYEFQFIRKRIEWYTMRGKAKAKGKDVFLIDSRKPIKARTKTNIMFLDSYIMSGKSLADLGDSLRKYKVNKMVGDLDYTKIRNSKTVLTEEELGYCRNDVLVVIAYIREEMEDNRNKIVDLALTNTSRVRTPLKDASYKDENWRKQIDDMGGMNPKLYEMLSRAFSGGFTHGSPAWVETELEDITSMDFTSSYPTCLLSEKFPSGKPVYETDLDESELMALIESEKPFVARFEMTGVILKLERPDGIIPSSKILNSHNPSVINGKIIDADDFEIYGTDVDLKSWLRFYDIGELKAKEIFIYPEYKPIPEGLQYKIVRMYEKKTTLKNVEGKEGEYMLNKGMLNSIYGMAVTRIMRDNYVYDGLEYYSNELDNDEKIEILQKYSEQIDRPTAYEYGVWDTAYARANLFDGIENIGYDYVYSDTDSIKFRNYEKHKAYFEEYNRKIVEKFKKNCRFADSLHPKDVEGNEHQLGVWDFDGHYKKFKTLRAKAYMYTDDKDKLHLTLAGCGKKTGVQYFEMQEDPYETFNLDCVIPIEYTGKLIPVDNDDGATWEVTDYQGNTETVTELSFRTLKPVGYAMNQETNSVFRKAIKNFRKDRSQVLT